MQAPVIVLFFGRMQPLPPVRETRFHMRLRPFHLLLPVIALVSLPPIALAQQAEVEKAAIVSAKSWPGHAVEIEDFIKKAEFERIEEIGMGVTNPKRAYIKGGGLVDSVAWKPIRPGLYKGFWESYKAEIAAYEIDKYLGMNMVPPAVEKKWKGDTGAAILWVKPVRMWKEAKDDRPMATDWDRQVIRMKMFDNLIGNKDRNMGNLLIDPSWNLMLIDHSRAFIGDKKLAFPMTRIDKPIWEKMLTLTEENLATMIGPWVGKGEIRAILKRRDLMKDAIDEMLESRAPAAVFVQ